MIVGTQAALSLPQSQGEWKAFEIIEELAMNHATALFLKTFRTTLILIFTAATLFPLSATAQENNHANQKILVRHS